MKNQKAFTLIELLVVIATIALLASIVLVALKGAREKAQIAKTLQWARSVKAQLGGDIVGDWSFNEGQGTTTLDATGYNNGTLMNGVSWTDGVRGLTGKALQFDGVDDYVDTINNLNPIPTTAHTFAVWFKPNQNRVSGDGLGNWGLIEGSYIPSAWNHNWLYLADGIIAYYSGSGGLNYVYTPVQTFYANTWYYAVITANGGDRSIYINGQKVVEQIDGSGNSDQLRRIIIGGNCYITCSNFFNGSIDEVRIYNRALTAMEIQKYYAEKAKKYQIAEK